MGMTKRLLDLMPRGEREESARYDAEYQEWLFYQSKSHTNAEESESPRS